MSLSSAVYDPERPGGHPDEISVTTRRDHALILALFLVGAHFWWLVAHSPPAYQSPDANGYYAQVELLANHGRTELEPRTPLAYIGWHWLGRVHNEGEPDEYETFHSRYSPGIAWLLALPYKVLGPELTLYITPLMASLTLFFLFLLCRPHVGAPLGLEEEGGIYWMVPSHGNVPFGSVGVPAALSHLTSSSAHAFRFVATVKLSEVTRHPDRPQSPSRRNRKRQWIVQIGRSFGPPPGQEYRLFKLVFRG